MALSDIRLPNGARCVLSEVCRVYAPMAGNASVTFVRGTSTPITLKASVAWPVLGGQTDQPSLVPEITLPGA